MVWLGDEAIRSLGLPGELGHSDKVLPHTKIHIQRQIQIERQRQIQGHTKPGTPWGSPEDKNTQRNKDKYKAIEQRDSPEEQGTLQ